MNLIERSYEELFGERCEYEGKIVYSGYFKGFNANIRKSPGIITVSMSRQWEEINEEIKIGLIQTLLLKIFKKKGSTHNIDFYNNFLRNVHIAIPKNNPDTILRESFDRVNEKFFSGLMERPSLFFNDGASRLGTYDYGTDTITISRHLAGEGNDVLDYVMYHEMLHKKHKFKMVNNRSYHHTHEFREKESSFPDSQEMEVKLRKIARKLRLKRLFGISKI